MLVIDEIDRADDEFEASSWSCSQFLEYELLAAGVAAALSHVDRFLPGTS